MMDNQARDRIFRDCEALTRQETTALHNRDLTAVQDAIHRRGPLLNELTEFFAREPQEPEAQQRLRELATALEQNRDLFTEWREQMAVEMRGIQGARHRLQRIRQIFARKPGKNATQAQPGFSGSA